MIIGRKLLCFNENKPLRLCVCVSRLCPYDPNHKVLAKRFQYHIMRCAKVDQTQESISSNTNNLCFSQKAYPHIRRVKCSFNATHLTAPNDLFQHMSTCPDNQAVHDAIANGMGDFSKCENHVF